MRHKVSTRDNSVITQHPLSPMGHKEGTMKHRMELENEKTSTHARVHHDNRRSIGNTQELQ